MLKTGKEVRFREIERYIRLVFDKQGILIARRVSLRSPLRFTGKGMGKTCYKKCDMSKLFLLWKQRNSLIN